MKKKIVSAGSVCIDITPVFEQKEAMDISKVFLPGKLIGVGPAEISAGGSISNTGLGLQFFGADVTLMAKVGQDNFGKMIVDIADSYGVNNKIKMSEDSDTSYSVVIAPPGVDRIFLHCPGANDTFGYEDIDFDAVKEADLFHFGYPTIMKRLYENPEELIAIFKKCKELHTLTSLDLAAITEGTEAAKVDWCEIFKQLLPYVDYFVPSVEEICFLIDRNRYHEWEERAQGRDMTEVINWEEDVRPLADQLIEWGAKIVLIKCGTPGMYLRTADLKDADLIQSGKEEWQNVEKFEESYVAEKFCSATGAGDVSIASFLTAALDGKTPEKCLQLATAAGACCVKAYDALGGLVSVEEMEERIEKGWEKNTK